MYYCPKCQPKHPGGYGYSLAYSRINDALRALGKEAILEIVPIPVRLQ